MLFGALLSVLLGLAPGRALAQDIHFSQIHASPTVLNPAMTGLFDGQYRVIANYRQQWRNATANYRTLAAAADFHVAGLGQSSLLSGGINLMADRAGDLDFTTSSAMFTLGAARKLNAKGDHAISVAIQGGILHQSLDYSALHVFDQEPAVLAGTSNSRAVPDVSAGLAWYKRVGKEHRVYGGMAMFHLASPDMALLTGSTLDEENLARRSVIHGGGEFRLSEQIYAQPSFILLEQSPNREITLGSFVRYDYQKGKEDRGSSLYLGSWFRWFYRPDIASGYDALVLAARWDKDRLSCGLSYDVNLSSLTAATRGVGGPELSIIYIGEGSRSTNKNKKNKVDCPKF
jgi:type IX secretion system PorP/SprF family membrane protein